MEIVGDRLARPYLNHHDTRDKVAALLPSEVTKVTVLARTGVGDWTVRLFVGSEMVGMSSFNRTIVPGVERALSVYRGKP